MQPISTRLIMTLAISLVLLGLVALRVVMNYQNRVAAQVVNAHHTSMNGVLAKMNAIEQSLIAERTTRAELIEGCKDGLRETSLQLIRQMEALLVQQEMRLIRNLEMNGAARSTQASHQQVIQPSTHQTILPESHAANGR